MPSFVSNSRDIVLHDYRSKEIVALYEDKLEDTKRTKQKFDKGDN